MKIEVEIHDEYRRGYEDAKAEASDDTLRIETQAIANIGAHIWMLTKDFLDTPEAEAIKKLRPEVVEGYIKGVNFSVKVIEEIVVGMLSGEICSVDQCNNDTCQHAAVPKKPDPQAN